MKTADVLVVGGGASGLTAAVAAAERGNRVLVLEAQSRPGRKILASGNGRCNLMNLNAPRYYGDAAFAGEVLRVCDADRIKAFWSRYGLHLRATGEGLVYPCTFQASTVMDTLLLAMKKNCVECLPGHRATAVERTGSGFRVTTEGGDCFSAPRVIVATGGPAQPKLGGRADALSLLKDSGHRFTPFVPSLTPLVTDSTSVSGLAGIRVRCVIRILTDGRETHRERGEVLFTEDGISGICAMQCARFVTPGKSICRLNLIEDLFPETEDAMRELTARKAFFPREDSTALIRGICVPRLAFAVCKQAGLAMRGETNADLEEKQIRDIVGTLAGYTLRILDRKGFESAQVSAGGFDCGDFDPGTMASRIVPGLHVTGEALNVDGDCGGFNLMFAWASGLLAGWNGRSREC